MRLTLVHNPTAGGGSSRDDLGRDDVERTLRAHGWRVRSHDADAGGLARVLDEPADLVAVVGGDGTVAKVAKRLAGRDVPLAIVPTGGSNNIARSFGIAGAPPALLHALRPDRLAHARRVPWNVGLARAPWGEARFVESAGLGPFASLLRAGEASERGGDHAAESAPADDKLAWGRRQLAELVAHGPVRPLRLELDDEVVHDELLLVELLNVRSIGPRIVLAPGAGQGDDRLALVVAAERDRRALADYVAALADGGPAAPPLPVRFVRRVRVEWAAADGHLDDEPWPRAIDAALDDRRGEGAPLVEITVDRARLELLLPDAAAGTGG